MTKPVADGEKPPPASRKERLAQALRDNLRRRKAQARTRKEDRQDQAGEEQAKDHAKNHAKNHARADLDDAGGTQAKNPGRGRPS